MPAFRNIEAVLFDLGGTLVDYPVPAWPVVAVRCARGVYDFLIGPGEPEFHPAAARGSAAAWRRLAYSGTALPHRAMTALRRVARSVSSLILPGLAETCARHLMAPGRLFDDAMPTLGALKDRGYRLGLVSNTPWGTPEYLWMGQLDRFALAPYFEARCFSSVVGFRKPDARIFEAALKRLGVPAARALFVGDMPEADIAGARRAGLRAVLIARPGGPPPSTAPAPDLRIASLAELLVHLPGPAKTVDSSRLPS